MKGSHPLVGCGSHLVGQLMRPGITTHSFRSGQQLVEMKMTARGPNRLNVTVPPERNVAHQAGTCFITDADGDS